MSELFQNIFFGLVDWCTNAHNHNTHYGTINQFLNRLVLIFSYIKDQVIESHIPVKKRYAAICNIIDEIIIA